MAVNLKRIVQSNGFKIYFWPISMCYLISALCLYLFLPIEPDSSKEHAFVFLDTILWLGCLWFIVFRYRKITGKTVGRYLLPIEDLYILISGEDFDGIHQEVLEDLHQHYVLAIKKRDSDRFLLLNKEFHHTP